MAGVKQIRRMITPHGFKQFDNPGFLGFRRVHADGRSQGLSVFTWSNDKIAFAEGIPRSYLVLCMALGSENGSGGVGGRYRLPLVHWPSEDQPIRPWAEVIREFRSVFMPMYDGSEAEGVRLLANLDPWRYQIWHTQPSQEEARGQEQS